LKFDQGNGQIFFIVYIIEYENLNMKKVIYLFS